MTSERLAGLLVGIVFGVTLSWTGLTSPEVLRDGLLFKSSYLFLVFGSAVATAFVGQRLLKARGARALLTHEPVSWDADVGRPKRRHVTGALMFGVGWGIADVCPGPLATQLGQGVAWSLFTLAGVTLGLVLFMRRQRATAA
jgi:uncharacterized membrane protein YedE/YeeE